MTHNNKILIATGFISLFIFATYLSVNNTGTTVIFQQSEKNNEPTKKITTHARSPELNTRNKYQDFQNNRPSYLKNTDLRGQFTILKNGSLLINSEIKKRFDYFYIMTGDLSQNDINLMIAEHIRQELTGPAQAKALELLNQYSNYLNEYDLFIQSLEGQLAQNDPIWVAEEIKALRAFYLGEEVSRQFFQQEEILRDHRLQNPEQSNIYLPQELLASQAKTLRLTNLQQQTAELIADGANAQQIRQMRVEQVGQAAAERLSQLDNSRQLWNIKKQQFLILKDHWDNISGLSTKDKKIAFETQAMEDIGLTDSELKRLKALDHIHSNRS
jgi:lipase chaperone LimK